MGKDEGWLICVWMMDENGKMLYLFYTPSKEGPMSFCLVNWAKFSPSSGKVQPPC